MSSEQRNRVLVHAFQFLLTSHILQQIIAVNSAVLRFLVIVILLFGPCIVCAQSVAVGSPTSPIADSLPAECSPLSKTKAVNELAAGEFAAALLTLTAATGACGAAGQNERGVGATDPEVWQGVGSALYGLGMPAAAERAFRAAYRLAPRSVDHRNNVAACLIDAGRPSDAISLLRGPAMGVEAAVRDGPKAAAAAAAGGGWKTLLNLASALAEEGRVEAGAARRGPPLAGSGPSTNRHPSQAGNKARAGTTARKRLWR